MFNKDKSQSLKDILVESVKINKNTGSSTCVMLKFDPETPGLIKTTNLGDSGYLIFRPNPEDNQKLLNEFKSREQQYDFNFPYQCGTGADLPYSAFDTEHRVQERDVIVVASDGMLDNLYVKDIKACIQPLISKSGLLETPQKAAVCLAKKSEKLGNDPYYFSPFAKNARDYGLNYRGGKDDDITVIVAQVSRKGDRPVEEL